MPSKPLFGSPVAVGISDAVMAMRSVVSAVAEWDDSSAVNSATVQKALRMGMIYLRPTIGKSAFGSGDTSKFQASQFPPLNKDCSAQIEQGWYFGRCDSKIATGRSPRRKQQRTVIRQWERSDDGHRCAYAATKGAIMKFAEIGLTAALVFTSSLALAQSSSGAASGGSAAGSAATSGASTDLPRPERHQAMRWVPAPACPTAPAAPRPGEQRAEPVRQHAYQSLRPAARP